MIKEKKILFNQLQLLTTESQNEKSKNIDNLDTLSILKIINDEDKTVAYAVEKELNYIAKAVELIVKSFKKGGRLFYVGAGTSGRLGILDAAEMPPTYGTEPNLIQGIIAGGKKTVFKSQEGVEDREIEAIRKLRKLKLTYDDVVCGIAASIRTPYVVAALSYAKSIGAKTILISTNSRKVLKDKNFTDLKKIIDVAICPEVGPEVVSGSTRMKSGTAQKMILNMLSTASMIRIGKVYGNLMVDLKLNSRKLEERAKRIIMLISGVDYDTAEKYLEKSGRNLKIALIMILKKVNRAEAIRRLKKANGFVRKALQ